MAKCLNCGKEIADAAKFCRYCGGAVSAQKSDTKECPQCHKAIPMTAKFCKFCGYGFNESRRMSSKDAGEDKPTENEQSNNEQSNNEQSNIVKYKNFITWKMIPGQLAVKIERDAMDDYGKVKGLFIAPGTKALFFVDGKFVAQLESGRYPFWNIDGSDKESNFWNKITSFVKYNFGKMLGRNNEMVVLMRDSQFELEYSIKDVPTATIRSEVGVRLLCEFNDLDKFFSSCLIDKNYVDLQSFAGLFETSVRVTLGRVMSGTAPQDVENNVELFDKTLEALRTVFADIAPFVQIKRLIDLTTTQKGLEEIRKWQEEMYVNEQELEHLRMRNEFLNKLQNVDYEKQLSEARSRVDFEALMDKVDNDGLLNADKKEQFVLMLEAEKELREAKTALETENAINKLRQSNMLGKEEIASLERQIAHRENMAQVSDAQAVAMATLQNAEALDREKLNWELEIGNKRFENELSLAEKRDDYVDKRRNSDLDYQQKIRDAQLEALRRLEDMNEQREQARHQREMESKKIDYDAEIERQKVNATMSFEQIMASNPDISPEAAAALAKKFEAEAAAASESKTSELMNRHNEDIKDFLARQMELTKSVIEAQNKANSTALEQKQSELDRVYADSEHHQDRMLAGMQTTVNSMRGMTETQVVFCPECGQKNSVGFKFCSACGAKLNG